MTERVDVYEQKRILSKVEFDPNEPVEKVFESAASQLKKAGGCQLDLAGEDLKILIPRVAQISQTLQLEDIDVEISGGKGVIKTKAGNMGFRGEVTLTLENVRDDERSIETTKIEVDVPWLLRGMVQKKADEALGGSEVDKMVKGYFRNGIGSKGVDLKQVGLHITEDSLRVSMLTVKEWERQQEARLSHTQLQDQKAQGTVADTGSTAKPQTSQTEVVQEPAQEPKKKLSEAERVWQEELARLQRSMNQDGETGAWDSYERADKEFNRVKTLGPEAYAKELEEKKAAAEAEKKRKAASVAKGIETLFQNGPDRPAEGSTQAEDAGRSTGTGKEPYDFELKHKLLLTSFPREDQEGDQTTFRSEKPAVKVEKARVEVGENDSVETIFDKAAELTKEHGECAVILSEKDLNRFLPDVLADRLGKLGITRESFDREGLQLSVKVGFLGAYAFWDLGKALGERSNLLNCTVDNKGSESGKIEASFIQLSGGKELEQKVRDEIWGTRIDGYAKNVVGTALRQRGVTVRKIGLNINSEDKSLHINIKGAAKREDQEESVPNTSQAGVERASLADLAPVEGETKAGDTIIEGFATLVQPELAPELPTEEPTATQAKPAVAEEFEAVVPTEIPEPKKEQQEVEVGETPLQTKMQELQRRRENVADAQLNYREAKRAAKEFTPRETGTFGPSVQKRERMYESAVGVSLNDYETSLHEMNSYIAEQMQALSLPVSHNLGQKVESLGQEAIDLRRNKLKKGIPQEERASLLKEYDLLTDGRLGALIELAERQGKNLISKIQHEESVVGFKGEEGEGVVKVREIKPIPVEVGRQEAKLVEVTFRGNSGRPQKSVYIKQETGSASEIIEIINKWEDLTGAGVTTNQEMFSGKDGKSIFVEDPSKRHIRDIVRVSALLLEGVNTEIPPWLRGNERLVGKLMVNAEGSASVGFRITSEAYIFTHNTGKQRRTTDVFVDSTSPQVARSKLLENELRDQNIFSVRSLVLSLGLMKEDEWNKKYPAYATRKR